MGTLRTIIGYFVEIQNSSLYKNEIMKAYLRSRREKHLSTFYKYSHASNLTYLAPANILHPSNLLSYSKFGFDTEVTLPVVLPFNTVIEVFNRLICSGATVFKCYNSFISPFNISIWLNRDFQIFKTKFHIEEVLHFNFSQIIHDKYFA